MPIIITTTSSPLCTALRAKIAPAVTGMVVEDRLMVRQGPFRTSGATIAALADNWIKINTLLDPRSFFQSGNADDVKQMEALRERLQAVADDENDALNVLSGTSDTEDLEQLELAGAQDTLAANAFGLTSSDGVSGAVSSPAPAVESYAASLQAEFIRRELKKARDEAQIYPALAPLIARCT
ncbi:MAG TPA: hypothetical protein VMD47_09220 [Candidatus Acidoferrales bacterium]|nr:hypothetical protein [Candidatus Acidoferrales bacterium]